jgi:hypothetical protein
MMADGLTKALSRPIFNRFGDMIGLRDLTERLALIKREEEAREALQQLKATERSCETMFTLARDLRRPPVAAGSAAPPGLRL